MSSNFRKVIQIALCADVVNSLAALLNDGTIYIGAWVPDPRSKDGAQVWQWLELPSINQVEFKAEKARAE